MLRRLREWFQRRHTKPYITISTPGMYLISAQLQFAKPTSRLIKVQLYKDGIFVTPPIYWTEKSDKMSMSWYVEAPGVFTLQAYNESEENNRVKGAITVHRLES